MTGLRLRLVSGYLAALLLPACLWAVFYRPERDAHDRLMADLEDKTAQVRLKTLQLEGFPAQLARLAPSKPLPLAERLDALSALRVPGLAVEAAGRDAAELTVRVRGGYREAVSFLEAVHALPFAARVRGLTLSASPEAGLLEGTVSMEVDP